MYTKLSRDIMSNTQELSLVTYLMRLVWGWCLAYACTYF